VTKERVQIFRENLSAVQSQIEEAAHKSGRDPSEVRLVVVTKTHQADVVRDVVMAGARILGENYAEEAVAKMQEVGSHSDVEWHMIGHVQSRKANLVVANFAMIHSLDSIKLARRLDRFSEEAGRVLPVLIEVNVSGEESKFGYPAYDEKSIAALCTELELLTKFFHLKLRGLMTMPPFTDKPEESRPYFKRLRNLRDTLIEKFPLIDWHELSMGTSADFIVAVEEGATLVRVGTAILGARSYV